MSEQQSLVNILTIDGPAASGKTSVSREVARKLGWSWVSTGAFYRGLAYLATQEDIPLGSEDEVIKLLENADWEVKMTPEKTLVFYNGEDVTEGISSEAAGAAASQISQYQGVRRALLQAQRNCAENVGGLVAEGRDCGTVVFPQAPVKIYLTARQENRAKRRAMEEGASVESTIKKQIARDAQDSGRQAAPMQVPENAHVLDTSDMNLEQVVDKVVQIVTETLSLPEKP